MASVFDQYNARSDGTGDLGRMKRDGFSDRDDNNSGPPSRQHHQQQQQVSNISLEAAVEPAMFQRNKIHIKFPADLQQLKVCSGFLVYVTDRLVVNRVNLLTREEQKDELQLADVSKEERVENLFLDPTGNHVVICMNSSSYYLHRLSKKPKTLSKFNGVQITAIGWNTEAATLHTTGPILIGTAQGTIFETQLNSSDDGKFLAKLSSTVEQYSKQVFDIGNFKVAGVRFGRVATNRSQSSQNYFVIIVTPRRLYQFFGAAAPVLENGSIFASIFEQYKDVQDIKYIDLPGEQDSRSALHTYQPNVKDAVCSAFAWMASPGVFCGNIDSTASTDGDSVIVNHKLIQYSKNSESEEEPVGLALTEFHVIILFKDSLKVVCMLNEKLIWEDQFEEKDSLQGIWRDPLKGLIWVFAKRSVFKYKITNEARNVWKILLEMKEYDRARAHCRDDPDKIALIYRQQADNLFTLKQFDQSAIYYARTQLSFEEVTLKFINAKQEVALRTYLEKRLFAYDPTEDRVQATMLVTWLVEIWLNQLGRLSDQKGPDGLTQWKEEREMLQEEFRLFLANQKIRQCLQENKSVIYTLISSHGDIEDMIFYADLMKDYEKVISHRVQNSEFELALEELQKEGDHRLVYKFSPLLMQHVPEATVNMWRHLSADRSRKPLDPKKLIPALVQYDIKKNRSSKTHEAIRYLEFFIRTLKNQDQAIHNYLISLYSQHDPEKLLQYLKVQGQDAECVNYDLKYALRLCAEAKLDKACVHIYSTMGLYGEAVNLALKVDLNLAKENANKPDDEDEKKKLWLTIARHVVEEQKNIDKAMTVLRECDLLRIEDILPFFPDFVTIDKFKEAITKSLAEYNEHISSLKEDMQDATESAEEIRKHIQDFRKKSAAVRTTDKCAVCAFPLITRSFYLFPCQHKFHSDCLIAEVLPTLSNNMRSRVEDLQRRVASRDDTFSIASTNSQAFSQLSAKQELDDLVAAECIYCGDQIIRSIDEPFISPEEYEEANSSWR